MRKKSLTSIQHTSTSHILQSRLAELENSLSSQHEHLFQQEQELARQRERLAQQQEEISRLRAALDFNDRPGQLMPDSDSVDMSGRLSGATTRRTLLRLGGVGAAVGVIAAASNLAGSTQVAHAAGGSGDGTAIVQGTANINTSQTGTVLNPVAASGPATLLLSDNSSSTSTDATQTSGVTGIGPAQTNGIIGTSDGNIGFGVLGQSDTGYGVVGVSTSGIDLAVFGTGRIQQRLQASAGAPTLGSYATGEQIRDSAGELWVCLTGGSPGTWSRVASVPSGYSGGAVTFLSKPIRLLDTRGNDNLAYIDTGGPIAGGNPAGPAYSLTVAGVNWQSVLVPSNAVGAYGNLTVVGGSGAGYACIVPHGAGFTGTSTVVWSPGAIVSNSFFVGLVSSQLDILIGSNASSAANVIIDLIAVVV